MDAKSPAALQSALAEAIKVYGKDSLEEAACRYELGLYALHNGNFMDANDYLGDALYIRRKYYKEDSPQILEIMYALQMTTTM